jgi:CheY-like chemotaxis protein
MNQTIEISHSELELPQVRGRVLVIEDDAESREALCHILELHGFEPYEAADGLEALEYLRNADTKPLVIVLDLRMPRMNGWEFLNSLCTDKELKSIPVVVLSGEGTRRDEDELEEPLAIVVAKAAPIAEVMDAVSLLAERSIAR